jgi:hypothetical protein
MEMMARFSDVRLAGVALLRKRAQGGTGKRIEGVKRGVHGLISQARRCCFLALTAAALAACATFETGPFLKEQITGDSWRACLAREYQAEARARVRADRDWTDATAWAAKGRAALAGEHEPESPPANPCECAKAHARADVLATDPGRTDLQVKYDEAKTACARPRPSAEAPPR